MLKNAKTVLFYLIFFVQLGIGFSYTAFAEETPTYTFQVSSESSSQFLDIKPGDKLKGSVEIILKDNVKSNFRLTFSSRADNVIADTGSGSTLNMSNWIEFPKGELVFIDGTAPGDQKTKVQYIINIPKSISPGDYLGSMRAIYVSEEELNSKNNDNAGVKISTAIGIRFKFSIPGDRFHKMEFLEMYISEFEQKNEETQKPRFVLNFKAKNFGNSILQAVLDVKIKNFKGKTIYEKPRVAVVFAGLNGGGEIIIDDLDPFLGWIDIDASLSYNLIDLEGKILSKNFSVGSAKIRLYSLPWMKILFVYLIISSFLLFLIYRHYTFKKLLEKSKKYVIKEGDTLQSVSEKFSLNAKDVIRVNKLKQPYFLTKGKELYIPLSKNITS